MTKEDIKQQLVLTILGYIEQKKSFAKTMSILYKQCLEISPNEKEFKNVKEIVFHLYGRVQTGMEDSMTEEMRVSILSTLLLMLTKD